MSSVHKPVLVQEVLEYLNVRSNYDYIDGTVGGGGHAEAILKANGPKGKLLGLDADPQAIAAVSRRLQQFGNRVILQNKNYKQIKKITHALSISFSISGILLDLGLSSDQLDLRGRGFSFYDKGKLDMRFDTSRGQTAADLIMTAEETELAKIFKEYGELREWKKLARAICTFRELNKNQTITTPELVEIVRTVIKKGSSKINPATKVFQALRIAINQELDNLEEFLSQSLEVLPSGARLVIISFHSLEDRQVKRFFQKWSKADYGPKESPLSQELRPARLKILTKKVVRPQTTEVKSNPRSRSALLRAAEIL